MKNNFNTNNCKNCGYLHHEIKCPACGSVTGVINLTNKKRISLKFIQNLAYKLDCLVFPVNSRKLILSDKTFTLLKKQLLKRYSVNIFYSEPYRIWGFDIQLV